MKDTNQKSDYFTINTPFSRVSSQINSPTTTLTNSANNNQQNIDKGTNNINDSLNKIITELKITKSDIDNIKNTIKEINLNINKNIISINNELKIVKEDMIEIKKIKPYLTTLIQHNINLYSEFTDIFCPKLDIIQKSIEKDKSSSFSTSKTETSINDFQKQLSCNNLLFFNKFGEIGNKINYLEKKFDELKDLIKNYNSSMLKADLTQVQIQRANSVTNTCSCTSQLIQNQSHQEQLKISNESLVTIFSSDINELKQKINITKEKYNNILKPYSVAKWLLKFETSINSITGYKIVLIKNDFNEIISNLYSKSELTDFRRFNISYKNYMSICSDFEKIESKIYNSSQSDLSGILIRNEIKKFNDSLDSLKIPDLSLDSWTLKTIMSSREKIIDICINKLTDPNPIIEQLLDVTFIKPIYGDNYDESIHLSLFKDMFSADLPNNAITKITRIGYKDNISNKVIKAQVFINKV